MQLLEVSSIDLEQSIKEEIEKNPVLESEDINDENSEDEKTESDDDNTESFDDEADEQLNDEPATDNVSETDKFDVEDYNEFLGDSDDDIPNYKCKVNNSSPDDKQYDIYEHNASEQSFQDFLISQLGYRTLSEKEYNIGKCLIGNIDEKGFLVGDIQSIVDDLAFSMNVMATNEEVEKVLHVVQEFDPAGVGARNLQECLLIQIDRLQEENPDINYSDARTIIANYYDEFFKKHYDKIAKSMGLDEKGIKNAINLIIRLDPRPGNMCGNSKTNNILPDFFVYNVNGKLELTLSERNSPDLHVSTYYKNMLNTYKRGPKNRSNNEAIAFLQEKVDAANWFIDAIRQRRNTLLNTMEAIMNYQREYFMTGDETKLRPMILKDISEKVGLDISTISRVTKSKYVQTDFGTFLLRNFFSEGMINDEGEEISTREIKKILSDCIDAENKIKPLTDDALAAMLKEKGYSIARRTVQKYREQLQIPVARLRKSK